LGSDTPRPPASRDAPDLVGVPWHEAQLLLAERGLNYRTLLTSPPGRAVGSGDLRVVAQRTGPDGLVFVLAYREYGK
jgi:hypothetical protein